MKIFLFFMIFFVSLPAFAVDNTTERGNLTNRFMYVKPDFNVCVLADKKINDLMSVALYRAKKGPENLDSNLGWDGFLAQRSLQNLYYKHLELKHILIKSNRGEYLDKTPPDTEICNDLANDIFKSINNMMNQILPDWKDIEYE